jgi:hypothetical protein
LQSCPHERQLEHLSLTQWGVVVAEIPRRWASFCDWQDYTWKNELLEQLRHVEVYFNEALDEEYDLQHSPLHMLERALALAAFSMRRLIEKRLVKDAFAEVTWDISTFSATSDYRPPFHSSSGGWVLSNYDFENCIAVAMRAGDIANEIIHSSQLLVLCDVAANPGSGLLIASDWNMKRRILHIPIGSLRMIIEAALNNTATTKVDWWDHETNKVCSRRE